MKKIKLFFLLVILTISNYYCTQAIPNNLNRGGKWILISLNGENLIKGAYISLYFTGDTISGSSGCNSYSTPHKIDSNKKTIKLTEIMMTTKACSKPKGILQQESHYIKLLTKINSYKTHDNELRLYNKKDNVYLSYRFQPDPKDQPLENTNWKAQTFLNGGMAFTATYTSMFTITFKNGTMTGRTGCNSYHGSYTVSGKSISIINIRSTPKSCSEKDHIEEVNLFFKLLNKVESYRIKGNLLSLRTYKGNGFDFRH